MCKTGNRTVGIRERVCYHGDTMTTDDTVLLLARELEWAEAFLEDFPDCEIGWFYFHLLERELARSEKSDAII